MSWPDTFVSEAFITAAGYSSAASLYDLGNPPFINDHYTVGQFEVRTVG
jgi:hypothetical protein